MAAAPDVTDVLLADRTNRKKRLFKTRQISEKGCFMASHNTEWSVLWRLRERQDKHDQRKEKVETRYSKKHKSTIMR